LQQLKVSCPWRQLGWAQGKARKTAAKLGNPQLCRSINPKTLQGKTKARLPHMHQGKRPEACQSRVHNCGQGVPRAAARCENRLSCRWGEPQRCCVGKHTVAATNNKEGDCASPAATQQQKRERLRSGQQSGRGVLHLALLRGVVRLVVVQQAARQTSQHKGKKRHVRLVCLASTR
jgi:hypothetical protein